MRNSSAPGAKSDYAELKRRIVAAGLLEPAPAHAAAMIVLNTFVFAALFALLWLFDSLWQRAAIAALLGLWSGQIGFQLHDSGHRQMFRNPRWNAVVAFFSANLLLGMSSGWWIDKHNRHHGNPNHLDLDPDIKVGMVSYSPEQAEAKRGIHRWVAARQAYLFFPLLFGLGWAMHLSSIRFLTSGPSRLRRAEVVGLVLHVIAYVALLIALVGPATALLVIVIQKCVGGFYLACVFAPNHKGMPQVHEMEQLDFLRSQVLTSRNVRSHRLTDFLYGGLNYQVEHHLFPTMPRRHVRAAQPIVRGFCSEIGVPYYETSIVQSYREILGFLHDVGASLRRQKPAPTAAAG